MTAEQEREAVVRFLKNLAFAPSNTVLDDLLKAAHKIEAGEHLMLERSK